MGVGVCLEVFVLGLREGGGGFCILCFVCVVLVLRLGLEKC